MGNAARIRRKQLKQQDKKKKFITITEAEIERRIEDAYEKLLLRDLDIHYKINVPLWLRRCLWTMHSRYGWGKKRLNQFLVELIQEHKCINEKYLSDEDIEKGLKDIGVTVKVGD
ncbi:MAG: hypothetical protein ACFFD2_17215 [Promethearchaeota archaeon]